MSQFTSAINWFEIPALDFDRAVRFYSAIYDFDMPTNDNGTLKMGFFAYENGKGIGGTVVFGEGYEPVAGGIRVYLAAGDDLCVVLDRVADAGGKVLAAKTEIAPGVGFMALIEDSEGNHVHLHSMN